MSDSIWSEEQRRILREDESLTPQELQDKYGPNDDGEHPVWFVEDWRIAVHEEATRLSYWQWLALQIRESVDA